VAQTENYIKQNLKNKKIKPWFLFLIFFVNFLIFNYFKNNF